MLFISRKTQTHIQFISLIIYTIATFVNSSEQLFFYAATILLCIALTMLTTMGTLLPNKETIS